MRYSPEQSEFQLHLLEKLHCLLMLPILHLFCNLLIPCKIVQFTTLSSTIAAISVATHGSFHQSLKMLHVSYYVWNPGTFHLPTTKNPDKADQPCILWMPDKRTERATTNLLHQWENFFNAYCIYLASLAYFY